jgi:rhamnosyltransferase subunit B
LNDPARFPRVAAMRASPAPHVLVAAFGSAGDLYPFLRIARDLQARGHRVTVLGLQAHAAKAAAAGVAFHGFGTDAEYIAFLEQPDLWHPRRGFGVIWRGLRDGMELMPEFVGGLPPEEPCVMLAHPLALPGAALLRALRPDLRIVAAWLAPSNLRSVHDPLLIGPLRIPSWMPLAWRHRLWRHVDARIVDPVALPDLNAARARRGLPPVSHLVDHLQAVPDAHVTLFPSWFAPTPPDWPQPLVEGSFALYDPHPDDLMGTDLERFLRDGAAPIVFTPGSGNRQATRWFERALQASRRLGRRAIFLTPHRAQVPATLPASVLWLPYVPLRALLPRVAALVHHGGIGTTAEALRAGVPQLIVPMAYDQFDNGARVEALAAGKMLAGRRARPRVLAATLERMLASQEMRAGCTEAARRIADDAQEGIVGHVELLLGLVPARAKCVP